MTNPTPEQKLLLSGAATAFNSLKLIADDVGASSQIENIEFIHVHACIGIQNGTIQMPKTATPGVTPLQTIIQAVLAGLAPVFTSNPALALVYAGVVSLLQQLFPTA